MSLCRSSLPWDAINIFFKSETLGFLFDSSIDQNQKQSSVVLIREMVETRTGKQKKKRNIVVDVNPPVVDLTNNDGEETQCVLTARPKKPKTNAIVEMVEAPRQPQNKRHLVVDLANNDGETQCMQINNEVGSHHRNHQQKEGSDNNIINDEVNNELTTTNRNNILKQKSEQTNKEVADCMLTLKRFAPPPPTTTNIDTNNKNNFTYMEVVDEQEEDDAGIDEIVIKEMQNTCNNTSWTEEEEDEEKAISSTPTTDEDHAEVEPDKVFDKSVKALLEVEGKIDNLRGDDVANYTQSLGFIGNKWNGIFDAVMQLADVNTSEQLMIKICCNWTLSIINYSKK